MDIYEKIGIVCRQIPAGKVATYGQIALLCEKPQNSRQVGYALKKGLSGEGIPAYRVVNSKGILSGASYFETCDMQKLLLEEEGIEVNFRQGMWCVDLKKYGWENTIEDFYLLQNLFGGGMKEESAGTTQLEKNSTKFEKDIDKVKSI